MICDCVHNDGKECKSKATYLIKLRKDFDSETCFWCSNCTNKNEDMIIKKTKL